MILVHNISTMQRHLADLPQGKRIAFVPTMGALHDGHLSLVKQAQELADIVVVSIFVNQAQFNDPGDYQNYPRQDAEDLQKLKSLNVDFAFLPSPQEMDKVNYTIQHIDENLTNCLCGSTRPGHFDGVVLIISKFFTLIKPHIAIFGQKDFQQLAIIRTLSKQFNVHIIAGNTYREDSGLAMSSRNLRLSENSRIKAAQIYQLLLDIKQNVQHKSAKIPDILSQKAKQLMEMGFGTIDYLEIRQESDLKLITNLDFMEPARIFIAVHLDGVRLIDNLAL